jgi:hypothetical protein
LVAAFADLGANDRKFQFLAEVFKGSLPRFGVHINRVNERSVNVENYCFNHYFVFLFGGA